MKSMNVQNTFSNLMSIVKYIDSNVTLLEIFCKRTIEIVLFRSSRYVPGPSDMVIM